MNLEFNPATLAIIAVVGAVTGGALAVGNYMLYRAAKEVGEEMAPEEARIKLPIPSGELKRLPLPHEVLFKLLQRAP